MRSAWSIALLGMLGCRTLLGFEEPTAVFDAAIRCDDSGDCAGAVCKLPEGVCVECLDSSTCTAANEPICDTATNRCAGCRTHAECFSNACLPDGSCADAAQVAYVSPTGSDNDCTPAKPCSSLSKALGRNLPVIKIEGPGVVSDNAETSITRTVTILAEGMPQIDRNTDGTILKIDGNGADVRIYDLQIIGASGQSGDAVLVPAGVTARVTLERVVIRANARYGVNAGGGQMTIRRSVVSGNLGGGARITDADFELTNNLFVANGSSTSTTGGVTLLPVSAASVFDLNTIADNVSNAATQGSSNADCVVAIQLTNSIVKGNRTAAGCRFEHTLFDPGTAVTGTNAAGDPRFRSTDSLNPTSASYYRIDATSAAIDRAGPSAVATDIDGDPRPQGAGRDMGADEVK